MISSVKSKKFNPLNQYHYEKIEKKIDVWPLKSINLCMD